MLPSLLKFLKLDHYDKLSRPLKKFGRYHLWFSIFFLLTPLYYSIFINYIYPLFYDPATIPRAFNIVAYIISIIIFANSSLNIIRENLLGKLISTIEVVHFDVKKELIRHSLDFLIDNYGWKGTCRATIFALSENTEKLIIYDRISVGIGSGDYVEGKCFFRSGQGIPGRAWQHAWSGDDEESLIESIRFGNVPENILRDDNALRRFFKENFNIVDDDIYGSLGPKKNSIKSYMAVGVLGRHHRLLYVLVLDSEETEKFADFESLQKLPTKRIKAEAGLTILAEGQLEEGQFNQLPDISGKLKELMEVRKKFGAMDFEEIKEKASEMSFMLHASHSREITSQAPSFVFSFRLVLKQIKEIILFEL